MKTKIIGNEYRTTVLCIDSYENRVIVGRLYNPFCPEGKRFNSLIELLLEMEYLLDQMQFPQPFNDRRTFSGGNVAPFGNAESITFDSGNCATFQVRILFRQNTSWQGSVHWAEGNTEESFRSVLELALLMDSALGRTCEYVLKAPLEGEKSTEEAKSDSIPERSSTKTSKSLTRDEYKHILQTAKRIGEKRAYMLIKTIVDVGVGQEELQRLSVEFLTEGSFWMTKYKKEVLVEILEPLRTELLSYAAEEGIQTGPIFMTKNGVMSHPHMWKEIKRVCREAGIAEERGTPKKLYQLSKDTYRSLCTTDTTQTRERLQRLLEKEEQYVSWENPNPKEHN